MGIYRDSSSIHGVEDGIAGRVRYTYGVEKVHSLPPLWHRKQGL